MARPIDPERPGSPWLICLSEDSAGRTFPPDATGGRGGASDYQAHLGANSGGANAVYWLRLMEKSDGGIVVENL